jgi:3-methyladenine DNA glycosylase AlkD
MEPELKALLRPLLASYEPVDRVTWERTVRALWDGATHREERYAAIAVARHRRARVWLAPESLPLCPALVAHRAALTPVLRAWASDEDLWVRRTAVICQLGLRADTDTDLLRHAIDVNVDDTTFWLRKAIGWALRDYARTDPDWVRAEVSRHGVRLSGLSRREALKHL